jgi:hypothetical protein
VESPSPGGIQNFLSAIACVSARHCKAVGGPGNPYQTLIESSQGSAWTVVPSPHPGGKFNALDGVSCTSRNFCAAVGWFGNDGEGSIPNRTLIESWNGSAWSIVSSPGPPKYFDFLSAVSCLSSRSCVAAGGSYVNNSPEFGPALIKSWNGLSWKTVTSASPGAEYNIFRAASCVKSGGCVATGIYGQGSTQLSLIEAGPSPR